MDDVWIVRGPGGYREVLGDVMEADDVNVNVMMVVVMVEVYEYASVRHRIRRLLSSVSSSAWGEDSSDLNNGCGRGVQQTSIWQMK